MLEPKAGGAAHRRPLVGDEAVATELPRPVRDLASEQVRATLYPTFGHRSPNGRDWYVGVSGVVVRPPRNNLRRKMMVRVLQRILQVPAADLRSEIFQRRVNHFLAIPERGVQFCVFQNELLFPLKRRSRRNGHFRDSFRPPTIQGQVATDAGRLQLGLQMPMLHGAEIASVGQAQLIAPTGLTVISDIDDTIKQSEVADRRSLLRNTFLHPFRAVDGMAELYRRWEDQGAAFHYVSSSPWQLFDCLQEFLALHGFPWGSFHLRAIRLKDPSILKLFVARRSTKLRVIRSIVRMFPHRRFILIGDSGERDPEIYGAIARRFPAQISQVLIRRSPGRPTNVERLGKAFRELPTERWRLFETPDELLRLDLR